MNNTNLKQENTQSCDVREIINTERLTTEDWVGMVNDLLINNHKLRNQLAEANQESQKWRTQHDLLLDGQGTPTDNLLKHICKGFDLSTPSELPEARVTWLTPNFCKQVDTGEAA